MMRPIVKEKIKIAITLAEAKDTSHFLDLEALCFGMTRNPDVTYFWTPAVNYLWSYKAEIKGKMVGGIISMPTRDGKWYVNSLFVHLKYRRLGIAKQLLTKIIRIAGKRKILLDVKTDREFLLEFYAKYGFKIHKYMKNYYWDGTDRYLMTKI